MNHRIRVVANYVDGKLVKEAPSAKVAAPQPMPWALVLATERFYLDSAYYHGLIGRTTVFDRALRGEEIQEWVARSKK